MRQNTKYSLNRIYMTLLGNTSRVHDPWGTHEVHIPTRTISTRLCGRSKRTIIISNNFRTDSLIITSHHPQQGRSPRALLILSIMSMHVHNIISIEGDDDASQSINMNIIHNHLNYHNYTGEINKTQSHKEFKSIIYQLMPICFGILKFQPTF